MCGIVGYISKNKVLIESQLLKILKRLEYRGYDSAGIGILRKNQIVITKEKGSIENLEKLITKNTKASIGIAHTRWATHGNPSKENAHPFISDSGKWAIVHNGIIENFEELKKICKNKTFSSNTDSEIIAKLLDLENNNDKILDLINVCNKLKGSFAVLCLNVEDKKSLYLAKRQNPLYVMQEKNEIIVASDPVCFLDKSKYYYSLNDDEFCRVQIGNIEFFDKYGNKVEKEKEVVDIENFSSDKGKYEHFMIKEIMEEGDVIKRVRKTYSSGILNKFDKNFLKDIEKVVFIGCGTAYHAGLMGARFIEKYLKIDARCEIASEFRYSNPIIRKNTLYFLVSQSGETADTLAANELIRKKGGKTLALTNVLHSTLAKNVDYCLPVCAGVETAVASTKAYVAQIMILYILARHFEGMKDDKKIDYMKEIFEVEEYFLNNNFSIIDSIAKDIAKANNVFYIGRDIDYISSLEASLKLKEVSYIYSSSYPSGELKHGFLALVDSNTYVIVIATNKDLVDKTLNGASEASARGGKIVLVTPYFDHYKNYSLIKLPDINSDLIACLVARDLQYLAYKVSIIKGINPDKPRNLAKSVTVE